MTAAQLAALSSRRDNRYALSAHHSPEAMRMAWRWRCSEVDELPIDEPRRELRDRLAQFRRRWGVA